MEYTHTHIHTHAHTRIQAHYYSTNKIAIRPWERGSLFLKVTRQGAERSVLEATKYLINHFYEMYGVEVCEYFPSRLQRHNPLLCITYFLSPLYSCLLSAGVLDHAGHHGCRPHRCLRGILRPDSGSAAVLPEEVPGPRLVLLPHRPRLAPVGAVLPAAGGALRGLRWAGRRHR